MSVHQWSGFGPEPMTDDEWRDWLRLAYDDELRTVANGRGKDAIDAENELYRRRQASDED